MDESNLNNFLFGTYFFGLFYKNIEDLGQMKPGVDGNLIITSIHTFCNTPIHIGRTKIQGQLFKFCPLCRVNIK